MTDTFPFDSISPRFGLPLLFTGQAQKEAFVNEAHAISNALLHCAIEGEAATPPPDPLEGESWLVAENASGVWTGKDGHLACRQAGNWIYIAPRDGLRVFDRSAGQERLFNGSWRLPAPPSEPHGGDIIDTEARAAIADILAAMKASGMIPAA